MRYALSSGAGVSEALLNGALIALLATAGALVLGWPAARSLAAAPRRLRHMLVVVIAMPLLVPQYAIGAGPLQRLALVSLPASRVALATAAVMALIVSWSQHGTTLAIGGETTTLPVMLVPFAQSDPQIAATLAILFLAPTLIALAAVARALRV